uniref:GRF-type domain-containing protein n=1 Tax=Chenopodium quinoa TaxID=63459 RepID=A0A803MM42_CHEQI
MSGIRQVSGGSGSSSTSRDGRKMKCKCGWDAILQTVKNGPNSGMKFYGTCNYFKWNSGDTVVDDLRFQLFEKETTISELELEKSMMEEKIKKLQMKKENAEEELQEMKMELGQMRIELMKTARNEKNFSMSLFFSWVFFAILVFYLK